MWTLAWKWERIPILFEGARHGTRNRNCAANAIQVFALRQDVQLRVRTSRTRKELQVRIREALVSTRPHQRCAERLSQIICFPVEPNAS